MKKVIFVIMALALMAIPLLSCTAKGVSQEEYDESKHQLAVIEGKVDALETQLSEIRGELEAQLSEIQEELEAQRPVLDEEPVGVQKLVGQGAYAEWEDDGIHKFLSTTLILTNPDSVSEITIDRISVFAYDGRLVYEGPLLKWREEIPWDESMKPHETRESGLYQYVSGFEWPSESEIWMLFTVEISWSGGEGGLPLTGWISSTIIRRDSKGHLIELEPAGVTQMVNMRQRIES